MIQDVYTTTEVANLLDCSIPTVYSYKKRGLIEKIEDPHRLYGSSRFAREGVDQLKREKEQLDAVGRSITEVAQRFGVYPAKVKKAITSLELDIQSVPSSPHSKKLRYAITPEHEEVIGQYLKQKKMTRIKRNHLYFSTSDIALYQAFLIAGEQPVRVRYNDHAEVGFYLEDHQFIPYLEALRSYDLEPRYDLHQERRIAQQGFTDLVISTRKKAFYQILDMLYAVCGVENFNAEIRSGNLVASIRNGRYSVNGFATEDAFRTLQAAITSGKLESVDGYWIFIRSERIVQLNFEEKVYEELNVIAEAEGLSFKDWVQQVLKEKHKLL